jgi:hypothetical protein
MDSVYTFAEAAARLRVSTRNFQGIIQRHPFYFKNGKKYLFTETDLIRISDALRSETTLRAIKDPNYGGVPMPSEAAMYEKMRKLTARKRRR